MSQNGLILIKNLPLQLILVLYFKDIFFLNELTMEVDALLAAVVVVVFTALEVRSAVTGG